MKDVYISCPKTVSQETLDKVIKLVRETGIAPMYWQKDSPYDPNRFTWIIQQCSAFIIILPGLSWSINAQKMTSGSRKELNVAVNAGIPVYIAYENRGDGLGIYTADVKIARIVGDTFMVTDISGIASTRYNFRDFMLTFGSVNTKVSIEKLKGVYENNIESKTIDQIYAGADFEIVENPIKQEVIKEDIKPTDNQDNRLLLL